ncbi:MAG: hypothetical protein H0W62_05010 [Chitinophagales bacterium]|nr:hypothetical protein [Chitinophagales bacterium]
MSLKILVGFILLTVLASCLKPPDYDVIPVIQFDSISANHVRGISSSGVAYDSLTVVVSFTDGDGDLGASTSFPDDTIPNLFFKDSRTGSVYPFQFPYITPEGNVKDISGKIAYTLDGVNCIPGLSADTFHYTIQIMDRAGHLSNEVITPDIILECQ